MLNSMTRTRRLIAAGAAALALTTVGASTAAAAGPETGVGNNSNQITISTVPPAYQYTHCDSIDHRIEFYVNPGNVRSFWLRTYIQNVATGQGAWYGGWYTPTLGIIGGSPISFQARGTFQVYVELGYRDAWGTYRSTFRGWVPLSNSYSPYRSYQCTVN